ncbi:hypothetical protein BJ742DRAFT_734268 [Cladochytrium replicatum]|nr:hypothetical protein BJ742DRAFT_734268 [Cladochytrium replicatum]
MFLLVAKNDISKKTIRLRFFKDGFDFIAGGITNIVSALIASRTSDHFYSCAKERLKRLQGEPESALTGEASKYGGLADDRFTLCTFFNCFIIVPFEAYGGETKAKSSSVLA